MVVDKSKRLTILTLIMFAIIGNAFSNCEISGMVKDSITGEGLPFASVQILSINDSNLIKGAITDIDGNYTIKDILPGKYGLMASYMGYNESKIVVDIFIFHLSSLMLLSLFCGIHLFTQGFEVFIANFNLPPKEGSIITALFFGFAAAMLGISGFESSANFIEEQEKGVFRKTLKNMWIVIMIFNPLMAFLALAIIPMNA